MTAVRSPGNLGNEIRHAAGIGAGLDSAGHFVAVLFYVFPHRA